MADTEPILSLYADGRVDFDARVNDAELAVVLRGIADMVESGAHRQECPSCAQGAPHDHSEAP